MNKSKNGGLEKALRIILLIIAIAILLFALYKIYDYFSQISRANKNLDTLIEAAVTEVGTTPPPSEDVDDITPSTDEQSQEEAGITVDFEALKAINSDIIAWIYCKDSTIHFPVAQAEDNDYYMYRLTDGSYNRSGTIFADYRVSPDLTDKNTLIYGHNMKNGGMFAPLLNWGKEDWFKSHSEIDIYTPNGNYTVRVFSAFLADVDSVVYAIPSTDEEIKTFIDHCSRSSYVDVDFTPELSDRFVTLSTCAGGDEKRFVVIGVLTEKNT